MGHLPSCYNHLISCLTCCVLYTRNKISEHSPFCSKIKLPSSVLESISKVCIYTNTNLEILSYVIFMHVYMSAFCRRFLVEREKSLVSFPCRKFCIYMHVHVYIYIYIYIYIYNLYKLEIYGYDKH